MLGTGKKVQGGGGGGWWAGAEGEWVTMFSACLNGVGHAILSLG